jgi:hypothetical protein
MIFISLRRPGEGPGMNAEEILHLKGVLRKHRAKNRLDPDSIARHNLELAIAHALNAAGISGRGEAQRRVIEEVHKAMHGAHINIARAKPVDGIQEINWAPFLSAMGIVHSHAGPKAAGEFLIGLSSHIELIRKLHEELDSEGA